MVDNVVMMSLTNCFTEESWLKKKTKRDEKKQKFATRNVVLYVALRPIAKSKMTFSSGLCAFQK